MGVSSPFSFLRGASDAIELVLTALAARHDAIGIADRNTLAGVVRMHSACTDAGMRPLIGCRLDLTDAPSLLAYPIDRDGYGRLSRLLSLGKMRAEKGECELSLSDVAEHAEGIAFIAWPSDDLDCFRRANCRGFATPCRHCVMSRRAGFIAATTARGSSGSTGSRGRNGCTILATNDVHYHAPDRRPLQDVVTCIREKVTIATAGYLLNPNAERHLKSPEEMARLFARWPHAIAATREFADALHFSLDELRYEYPRETVPEGRTPQQHLEHLTWEGAQRALARRHSRQGAEAAQPRAGADREARLRALFPDRPRHRRLRAQPRSADPVPGARLGGEQRGLLLPRHHRGRPGDQRPAVRALHFRGARASRPTSTSISSMSGARK